MEYSKINKLKLISAWLIILMAMLACETSSMEREDDGHILCQDHFSEDGSWYPIASNCTYTCDNGNVLPNVFDENTPPDQSTINFFCSQAAASVVEETIATEPPAEAPTEDPTEPPTEAPTEEPVELPTPILTGDVTYCDAETHIINLRFVDGFNAENFNHQLNMGGVPMTCSFNQTNPTLLTCAYPATVLFPTSIKVESSDGSVVNEFEFNGSNCSVPVQSKEIQNEDNTESEGLGGSGDVGDACANDSSPDCLVIYCQYHPTEDICNK